jgi:hypothetical protein
VPYGGSRNFGAERFQTLVIKFWETYDAKIYVELRNMSVDHHFYTTSMRALFASLRTLNLPVFP